MSDELKNAMSADAAALGLDKDADVSAKPKARRKKKVSILTINKIHVVDYKDTALLRKFVNERGKMLPSRQTGNTASQQRQVAKAIKRAREMALMPFVVTEMNLERRERRTESAPAPAAAE
jgi:small subunit ribosomal protein S18